MDTRSEITSLVEGLRGAELVPLRIEFSGEGD